MSDPHETTPDQGTETVATEVAERDLPDEYVARIRKALSTSRTLAFVATLVAGNLLWGFDPGSGLFATVVVGVAGVAALASIVAWIMAERSVRTELREIEARRELPRDGA